MLLSLLGTEDREVTENRLESLRSAGKQVDETKRKMLLRAGHKSREERLENDGRRGQHSI